MSLVLYTIPCYMSICWCCRQYHVTCQSVGVVYNYHVACQYVGVVYIHHVACQYAGVAYNTMLHVSMLVLYTISYYISICWCCIQLSCCMSICWCCIHLSCCMSVCWCCRHSSWCMSICWCCIQYHVACQYVDGVIPTWPDVAYNTMSNVCR